MNMKLSAVALGMTLAMGAGSALAGAPDWGSVEARKIPIFYPGVSPIEWITNGTEHGGARLLKKGEACVDCHDEEIADMGKKMASGSKIEPTPIPGKAPSIAVNVQAANDGENLYLRFSWKQPKASGAPKMDADNPVKVAFMLEDNKIERADHSGCWETCHQDARTMPGADDKKTKYVDGGNVDAGQFYDLMQWRSGKGEMHDGYVADKRVMEGGKGLVSAEGKNEGGNWSVVFTRKLAGGGKGDIALVAGKTYNFGFAIHDDSAKGRFHHVSFGYSLGIDADADINAKKQ